MNYSMFVESLRRLYTERKISKSKVIELFENKKLSEKDMEYILSTY